MEKKEERKEENQTHHPALSSAPRSTTRDHLLMALIILAVMALGLFTINQFINWRYKNIFLQTPCNLCRDLNPDVEDCFIKKENVYQNKYYINLTNLTIPS